MRSNTKSWAIYLRAPSPTSRSCESENGNYGFTDMINKRFDGKQKLLCELTIKDGKIVYDLNGMSADPWDKPAGPHDDQAYRWTTFAPHHPSAQPPTEMPH